MISQIENIFRCADFEKLSLDALNANQWIAPFDIQYAVAALRAEFLDEKKLAQFIDNQSIDTTIKDKTIGVVCAGNLPLVGFGDMFYALLAGYKVRLKPSSKDPLMRSFAALERVEIVEKIEQLEGVEAILSMGSDLTCKILGEMFAQTKMLLRGSMHSVAILTGDETKAEIEELANDIFLYSSRGCRNVTHLYIPKGFDIEQLRFSPRQMLDAWMDCYKYEKAMSTLKGEPFFDGLYYILKEGDGINTPPMGVLTYSYLTDPLVDTSKIQHIARRGNFGQAQRPTLNDFANKQNVIQFLRNL